MRVGQNLFARWANESPIVILTMLDALSSMGQPYFTRRMGSSLRVILVSQLLRQDCKRY